MLVLVMVVVFIILVICLCITKDAGVVVFGILFLLVLQVFTVAKYEELSTEDCESKLPRNQECRLIAVPVEIKEEAKQ